jgi:GTP-binding protein HflX
VIDAASPDYVEQIQQVQSVLKEIGADAIPQLLVFNKVDALDADHQPTRWEDEFEIDGVQTPRIFVSAKDSTGLPLLRQRLARIASKPETAAPGTTDGPEGLGDES